MSKQLNKGSMQVKVSGIEFIYTLFMALIIALFFGLGVAAFYPSPEEPKYPETLQTSMKYNGEMTDEQTKAQIQYEKDMSDYQEVIEDYSRNVSMIMLGLALLAMTTSLTLSHKIFVMSNGFLLGGVFTLMYSMARGFMTSDTKYMFVIVSVGLLITLTLGYMKFVLPRKELDK